jgi:hypothetical protein
MRRVASAIRAAGCVHSFNAVGREPGSPIVKANDVQAACNPHYYFAWAICVPARLSVSAYAAMPL